MHELHSLPPVNVGVKNKENTCKSIINYLAQNYLGSAELSWAKLSNITKLPPAVKNYLLHQQKSK